MQIILNKRNNQYFTSLYHAVDPSIFEDAQQSLIKNQNKGREKTDINRRSGLIVIVFVVLIGVAYITLASQVNQNQTGSNATNVTQAHDKINSPENNNTNTSTTSADQGTSSKTSTQTNSTGNTKTDNQTQTNNANSSKVSSQSVATSNYS